MLLGKHHPEQHLHNLPSPRHTPCIGPLMAARAHGCSCFMCCCCCAPCVCVLYVLLPQNMYIKADGTLGAGAMQGKRMRTTGGYSGSHRCAAQHTHASARSAGACAAAALLGQHTSSDCRADLHPSDIRRFWQSWLQWAQASNCAARVGTCRDPAGGPVLCMTSCRCLLPVPCCSGGGSSAGGGPVGYAPVSNTRDNPPCNTLFVGNLGDAVLEADLQALFGAQQVRPPLQPWRMRGSGSWHPHNP